MNTWNHLKPIFEQIPIPLSSQPSSVQGLFYVPDPMLPPAQAATSPFFPVNSTLTLESRTPVWTLRSGNLEWRQSDLLRGTFVGSTAFQFWLNWSAATYDIHRFNTSPQDVDFNWVPLWIPEEYPLGRPPMRQQVPVLIEGEVQPLVAKLGKLWASNWWVERSRREQTTDKLSALGSFMNLTRERTGIANIPFLEERWSSSRENMLIGQTGRFKLSYYGYTGTGRQDVFEIQFCPMDTLMTANIRNPGNNDAFAPWVELVMPTGRHYPVETPLNLIKNWHQQMTRVITNRFNPQASAEEQYDDNEKLGRKQEKLKLMMRWRREVLNATQDEWVQAILQERKYVELLQQLAGQPLLSVNPAELERVNSSWIQEWFSVQ